MIKVIINADDFGIDENRTTAIIDGFKMGAVTHTTAMVNMPYCDDAMELAKSKGVFHKVGLHLNLTEGPAMTEAMRKCSTFCDSEGNFKVDFFTSMKNRLYLPRVLRSIVREEIEAQMAKFMSYKNGNTHFDSHHHIHTNFSIAEIAFPLAKKCGFKSVRLSRNLAIGFGLVKGVYKGAFNNFAIPYGWKWSKWFGDFEDFRQNFKMVRDGEIVEVMVHPMYGKSFDDLSIGGQLTDSGILLRDEIRFYNEIGMLEII